MGEDRLGYSYTSVRSYKTDIHWSQLTCVGGHAFLHPASLRLHLTKQLHENPFPSLLKGPSVLLPAAHTPLTPT